MELPDPLAVHLPSWVIQDGNYDDLSRGDRAAFALEFHAPRPLVGSEPGGAEERALARAGGDAFRYAASGRIVHLAGSWWAIDFGVPAFSDEAPPPGLRPGDWVRGEVVLSVDPFFYFERLAHEADAPALIHDWTVEKIETQAAPFIREGRYRVRDPARLGWKEIARTDAWNDDGGGADYVLHCRRRDGPARRTRDR